MSAPLLSTAPLFVQIHPFQSCVAAKIALQTNISLTKEARSAVQLAAQFYKVAQPAPTQLLARNARLGTHSLGGNACSSVPKLLAAKTNKRESIALVASADSAQALLTVLRLSQALETIFALLLEEMGSKDVERAAKIPIAQITSYVIQIKILPPGPNALTASRTMTVLKSILINNFA